MEFNAGLLEGQSAISQQFSDRALEILDEIFIDDTVHAARKHGIPMTHQRKVAAVVASRGFEVITESLAGRVQLLVVREATGHGLAARIDDPGARQHQMDEADVPKI